MDATEKHHHAQRVGESLAVLENNDDEGIASGAVARFPAFFQPHAYSRYRSNPTVLVEILLIEQFMVILMFDAVLIMLKAGYPQDLEQEFVVSLRS